LRGHRLARGEIHPPGLSRYWQEEEGDHLEHDAEEHDHWPEHSLLRGAEAREEQKDSQNQSERARDHGLEVSSASSETEGRTQESIEDHGPDEGEDLGKPAGENEGRAGPASPDSGSEHGAPERNTSGPMDTDSGTEDDKELNLYEAMMIHAEGMIYGMRPATYTVEELYCMIRDANPTLEDMVEEREEYGETVTEAIGDTIEEALRTNYLEIGDTDRNGEVTVRRTSKRAPERPEPVRQVGEGRFAPSGM
jgi:hypothetical protein